MGKGAGGSPSSGPSRGQDATGSAVPGDPESLALVKVLVRAGFGSRRSVEGLIASGRVSVDGAVAIEPLMRVAPSRAHVLVDGVHEATVREPAYLVLHKPPGVVATMHDPGGRRSLSDLLGDEHRGLFHVGRLDADSAGVQILMSDGELAHRLTQHTRDLPRSYLVQISGPVPPALPDQLRAGVRLDDELVAVDGCRVVVSSADDSLLEMTLHHRASHGVRRLLAAAGQTVRQVVCTQLGPVVLGGLDPGAHRPLTHEELHGLKVFVGL